MTYFARYNLYLQQNVRYLRKAIAILLLFSVMVRPFTQAYYLIDYQLRQDFIARTLCINKAKPQLNCNGKCYLAKRLQAAEERDTKAQHHILDKYELPALICHDLPVANFQPPFTEKLTAAYNYANLYAGRFAISVFHPPCQA